MRALIVFFIVFFCCWVGLVPNTVSAQKQAYQIFDTKGKKVKYNTVLKRVLTNDVIFLGELHDNPISHWLQREFIQDAYLSKKNVTVGAEMFELHQQWALDLYFAKKIDANTLSDTVKMWGNFDTDYRPVVEFAYQNNFLVYATNVPRYIARGVSKQGIISLDTVKNKDYLPPLPFKINYEWKSYQKMIEMMGDDIKSPSEATLNFVAAQAIKDATMGYRIHQTMSKTVNSIYFHLNGSYHSDLKEGTVGYFKQWQPQARILTLTTVEQENLTHLDKQYYSKADFIIVVPQTMTKTYRSRF